MRARWLKKLAVVSLSPTFRVQSDLVLINASVTDAHGTPVTDIAASRFHVYEDGREQAIKYCTSEDSLCPLASF